jgi:hypothetical protein
MMPDPAPLPPSEPATPAPLSINESSELGAQLERAAQSQFWQELQRVSEPLRDFLRGRHVATPNGQRQADSQLHEFLVAVSNHPYNREKVTKAYVNAFIAKINDLSERTEQLESELQNIRNA